MNRKYKKALVTMNISTAQKSYINQSILREKKIKFFQILILFVFFTAWEIFTRLNIINAFIFSSPSRVIKTLIEMIRNKQIFYHLGITLSETLISFTLVILGGIFISIILWWNQYIADIIEPYLVILNSLPKSALAPVFIVWLGNNMKTIIIAAISVSIFGTIITLYTDFNAVEKDKIKLIQTLGGNKKDILLKVIIPANIPSIISIMKVNIGLSLVGVIIGEFLAAKAGLGYLIIYGSQVFKLDWVILSILILSLVATILYKALSYFEDRYGKFNRTK